MGVAVLITCLVFKSFTTQTFLVCDAVCSFSFSMLTRLLFSLHIAGTPVYLSFTSKTACFLTLTHDIAHFNHILVQKLNFSKCCDVVISSTTVNLLQQLYFEIWFLSAVTPDYFFLFLFFVFNSSTFWSFCCMCTSQCLFWCFVCSCRLMVFSFIFPHELHT